MVAYFTIDWETYEIAQASIQFMVRNMLIYQKSFLNGSSRIYQQHLAVCQKMFPACNSFTYLKPFPLTRSSTICLRPHQVSYNIVAGLESSLASSHIVGIDFSELAHHLKTTCSAYLNHPACHRLIENLSVRQTTLDYSTFSWVALFGKSSTYLHSC